VAKPELGTKRECPECATKYYDLGRSPCVCPKCGASFEPDVAPSAQVQKAKAPKTVEKTDTDTAPASEKIETVSLEVLGAEEQDSEPSMNDSDEAALADIDIPDDDADADDDEETSDTFFDSDDDDTDVSDLLGTDVGKSNDEG